MFTLIPLGIGWGRWVNYWRFWSHSSFFVVTLKTKIYHPSNKLIFFQRVLHMFFENLETILTLTITPVLLKSLVIHLLSNLQLDLVTQLIIFNLINPDFTSNIILVANM